MANNLIEQTIKQHVYELNAVFVFPTQTAADLWADETIRNTETTAVAMERYLAWDDFKGNSIKSQHKDKKSIPSTMRQIFTAQMLSENAENPFLKSIIPPEYAATATGFINWIAGLLPGLSMWKTYFENSKKQPDLEDEDLLELYKKYKEFLDIHNLFDPAWETPPFKSDGNHYYIFFPEILSDYSEYKNLLENSSDDITLIHLPENNQFEPKVQFYSNSRTEIKAVALQLRKLHEEKKIPWNDIAISVPDLESYGPYLDRDLELYAIPHVMRFANPLSSSGAGALFTQIQNCVSSDFSFSSVKTLLLNTELPWKEPDLSAQLIEFGQQNNCICSFNYENNKIDVWKKSFSDVIQVNQALVSYYENLKKHLTKISSANSFDKIRTAYFSFRNLFFDMDNCAPMTDKLISRCISELGALIDLEKEFPECKVSSPYSFFITQLTNTNYLEQTNQQGVQILPYKTAAAAPFKLHVVIDSSQSALSVVYKQLNFLREDKRQSLLGRDDPNVTEHFIQLYAMNSSTTEALFTSAVKTFSGYAQASSYLTPIDYTDAENEPSFLKDDLYLCEKNFFQNKTTELKQIFETEKHSYDFWKASQKTESEPNPKAKDLVYEMVKKVRFENELINVSETHLKRFFECKRKWLIHYVINLNSQNNEAELINPFAMGNINHKILELFCNELKTKKQAFGLDEKQELTKEHEEILVNCLECALDNKKEYSYLARELLQTTKEAIFKTIKTTVTKLEELYSGYTVYDTERDFTCEIPEYSVLCKGKIDCMLQNPTDGGFVVLDFKSSSSGIPTNLYAAEEILPGQKEEVPDFQMPMYLYLLEHQKEKYPIEECCFFNIKDCTKKSIELEIFETTQKKLLECIEIYADDIKTQNLFSEPYKDFSECNQCDYRAICRKVFNVGKID